MSDTRAALAAARAAVNASEPIGSWGLLHDDARDACFVLIRDHGATLAEALRDAERYRWLREAINIGSGAGGMDRWAIDLPDPGIELDTPKVFDAAIDAARASGEP